MTTLSKKEVFKMSILTIQQVHQNNLVAKEFLMCIIRENQSYAEDKAFKKRLFKKASFIGKIGHILTTILMVFLSSHQMSKEMMIRDQCKHLEKNLKKYFKCHYSNAGSYSKIISPEIAFKFYQDGFFSNTIHTISIKKVPFSTH